MSNERRPRRSLLAHCRGQSPEEGKVADVEVQRLSRLRDYLDLREAECALDVESVHQVLAGVWPRAVLFFLLLLANARRPVR